MKLYELSEQYLELQQLGEDGEIPPEVIADTLEAIEGELDQKAENLVMVVQHWDASIDAMKAHKKMIDARIKAFENRKANLIDYLRSNMERTEINKISCPLFTITLVKGREVVIVDDEDAIPDEYVETKITTAPRKNDIAKALKNGDEIPGAHLERSKSSVRIK